MSSYNRVLGTLVAIVGDRAAAEDCAHDAYERALRSWPAWRMDAPAEAWLHRIAINTAISYLRHARLREVGQVIRRIGRPQAPPDPVTVAERSELFAAFRRLPPKQAAAIVLRHHHGYTNREIATALDIPQRTVASRLAAAKTRLRRLLANEHRPGRQIDMGSWAEDGVPSE